MPKIEHLIRVEINPNRPVPEILDTIASVMTYNKQHEKEVLLAVREALDKRIEQLTPPTKKPPKEGEKTDAK